MKPKLALTYQKIAVLVTLCTVIPIALICTTWYQRAKQELMASEQVKAQRIVTYTMGLLYHMNDDVLSGRMSMEEAQEDAKTLLLGPKRFDGTRDYKQSIVGATEREYIYAATPRALTVMHPFIEGADMWEYRAPDGRYLIRDLVNPDRFGKVLEYTWQNPGQEKGMAFDYAEYFPPWGWVVAYGGTSTDSYLRRLRGILSSAIIVPAIVLLVLLPCILWAVRKVLLETQRKS